MTWRCTCQHLPAPTEATSPANGNRQRGATCSKAFATICVGSPVISNLSAEPLKMAIFSLLCIQAPDW